MASATSSAFLEIANLALRQKQPAKSSSAVNHRHHLDPSFLTSYFSHHPAASAADDVLFSSPTAVMNNFLHSRSQRNKSDDSGEDDPFDQMLRGIAATLESSAKNAGMLRAAAKAMFVVLSMSPMTDSSEYLPRAVMMTSSSSSSAHGSEQKLQQVKIRHSVINSALPWDRLRPLLREIEQASVPDAASARPGLFSLSGGGLELLCSCSDSAELMNPYQYRCEQQMQRSGGVAGPVSEQGVLLAPNASRRHDFFTNELCPWAQRMMTTSSNPTIGTGMDAEKATATNRGAKTHEPQHHHYHHLSSSLSSSWGSEPAAWAVDAVSPAAISRAHRHASSSSTLMQQKDKFDQEEERRLQQQQQQQQRTDEQEDEQRDDDEEDDIVKQAARRTNFLRWEVPARLGGGNASWTALWHALHRACIGHGDTLGIVGPDPTARPHQPTIVTRVTVWPPALSFAPSLLSPFCRCGTLLLRIRHLAQQQQATQYQQQQQQQHSALSAENGDDEDNLLTRKHNRGGNRENSSNGFFALGRVGAAIFSAVQQFVRDFETDLVQLGEDASATSSSSGVTTSTTTVKTPTARKVTHQMILERTTMLQRDFCPRVYLVAELLHVTADKHWSASGALSQLGSGMEVLNSLYHWLAANEAVTVARPAATEIDPAAQRTAQLHGIIRELFLEGLHQFHNMLCVWVQRGQLEDPFGEFFLEFASPSHQQQQQLRLSGGNATLSSSNAVARVRSAAIRQRMRQQQQKWNRDSEQGEDDDGHDDADDDDNEFIFVPDFFSVDLGLVRDAGLAQLLLLAERRTDCVGVLWERLDEIDAMWPSSETLIWSTAPPDPSAVLAMWRDFVFELLPQSVLLLSTISPRRLLEIREQQEHAEAAAYIRQMREADEQAARQQNREQKRNLLLLQGQEAINSSRMRRNKADDNDDGGGGDAGGSATTKTRNPTHAQIWDSYMAEAKRDAAQALMAEHEIRMAISERRSERAMWRQRRLVLSTERRVVFARQNDNIVETLQEFVVSGRDKIAIPMQQQIAVSNFITWTASLSSTTTTSGVKEIHDGGTNVPLVVAAANAATSLTIAADQKNSNGGIAHESEEDCVKIEDDALTTSSATASSSATTTTTTTTTAATAAVPRWKQQVPELTRIGEDNPATETMPSAESGANSDQQPPRSFQTDLTWHPLHDAVGSTAEFETPEQLGERIRINSEKLLPSHIATAADDNWFLKDDGSSEEAETQQRHAGNVQRWAQECMTLSAPRERKRSARGNNEDRAEGASPAAVVPIATLCDRYRIIFAPLCRRLIHRAVRVSLQDPCGSLRCVTDALLDACLLQHPTAAVLLQERVLSRLAPSALNYMECEQTNVRRFSSDAAAAASTASARTMPRPALDDNNPHARLRSCGVVWKRFWFEELQGEHSRFLNLSLESTSSSSSSSLSSSSLSSASPLILLQSLRLVVAAPNTSPFAAASSSSSGGGSSNQHLYRHMFDALLPQNCIERHGRILCSLLTWTLVDKMCVALWRGATSRLGSQRQQQQQEQQQQQRLNTAPAASASSSSAAALWKFVNVARGVLTALRQHMWHNVCSAANHFKSTIEEKLLQQQQQQHTDAGTEEKEREDGDHNFFSTTTTRSGESDDGDDDAELEEGNSRGRRKREQSFSLGLSHFTSRFEHLLEQASDACWLGSNHVEIRKTLSVLMRLVEHVFNSSESMPGGTLLQATEQFVAASRALQAQILDASTPTTAAATRGGGGGSSSTASRSTAAAYAVASAIGTALPATF